MDVAKIASGKGMSSGSAVLHHFRCLSATLRGKDRIRHFQNRGSPVCGSQSCAHVPQVFKESTVATSEVGFNREEPIALFGRIQFRMGIASC